MSTRSGEKKAKIGFVGCGNHATTSLYPTIHTIPEIELAAVCDLKEEKSERNARNFGALKWYTDLKKMLSEEKLDGAIVVGIPQMQCEVGKECLDAGLPIFVEKPSAISYKEAVSLSEHAKKNGLFGGVGYMKRSSTCYRMAKSIVQKKEFGKISALEARFSNGPYPAIWGIKENTRCFLITQAVHIFNLIRFFCGEVDEVYARLNQIDDNGHFAYAITVVFKNGAVGVLNLNAVDSREWKISEYLALSGHECWLEVRDMVSLYYHPRIEPMPEFNPEGRCQMFTWQPDWTELVVSKTEGAFGYRGELQNFARAILGKENLRADLFDGAKDLQISEAVWKSSQTKKAVKIADG